MDLKTKPSQIALDMDEVMCSLVSTMIFEAKKLWPDRQFKLPSYGRYNFWFKDNFGSSGKEYDTLRDVVCRDEFYLSLPSILNAAHGHSIEKLSKACWSNFDHITVITHRDGWMPHPQEVAKEWLRVHGFVDYERVDIQVLHMSVSKVSAVKRSTVFVDDSVVVADAVTASRNHQMILVNHPWNDGYPRSANCVITSTIRLIDTIRNFATEDKTPRKTPILSQAHWNNEP